MKRSHGDGAAACWVRSRARPASAAFEHEPIGDGEVTRTVTNRVAEQIAIDIGLPPKQQNAGRITARKGGPFARCAIEIDRLEFTSLATGQTKPNSSSRWRRPAGLTGRGLELQANSIDLAHIHPLLSQETSNPGIRPPTSRPGR